MGIIKAIYLLIRAFLLSRLSLAAETLALRQQAAVYLVHRQTPQAARRKRATQPGGTFDDLEEPVEHERYLCRRLALLLALTAADGSPVRINKELMMLAIAPARVIRCAAVFAMAMSACHPVLGEIDARELVVTVQLPKNATPAQTLQAAEAQIAKGVEHWREAMAAMRCAENVWGCLCGPHLAALSEIVRRCDRQRLLWGSNYGFSFADVVGYRLGLLQSLRLTDYDYERITADNPRQLLGPVFSGRT